MEWWSKTWKSISHHFPYYPSRKQRGTYTWSPLLSDHTGNLAEIFDILIKYKMKLNPAMCIFVVSSGRFLGYLVTKRGIEEHPKKIRAILKMKSLSSFKEIQSIIGWAVVLNRFSRGLLINVSLFSKLSRGHNEINGMMNAKELSNTWRSISHHVPYYPRWKQ